MSIHHLSCLHYLPKNFSQESVPLSFNSSAPLHLSYLANRCLMPGQKLGTLFLPHSCWFSELPEVKEYSLLHNAREAKAQASLLGSQQAKCLQGQYTTLACLWVRPTLQQFRSSSQYIMFCKWNFPIICQIQDCMFVGTTLRTTGHLPTWCIH